MHGLAAGAVSSGVFGVPPRALALGVLFGLMYALLGIGLVLVYRSTRVINFAHGQVGALCAVALAKLVLDYGWNFFAALIAVMALGGLISGLVELLVVRRLFTAPRLQLFVATLGIAQILLVAQFLIPPVKGRPGAGFALAYPTPLSWRVDWGQFFLVSEDFMALIFAPAAILLLGVFLTRTRAGLMIRAAADNQDMAELSGISIRRASTLVWVLAGALAALTSVLLYPLQAIVLNSPTPALGPGLLMPALAAALVGRLTSLPGTLAGGVVIGVLQMTMTAKFPNTPGLVDLMMFVLVVVLVLVRKVGIREEASGQWSLAMRVAPRPRRLHELWWARHLSTLVAAVGIAFAIALPYVVTDAGRIFLFSRVLIVALIGLSVTVLTGWGGQLSLGQYAFAGLGALTTAALVSRGFSFTASVAYAVVAGTLAALVVGFPALRVKGLFLAVTTLAFAVVSQGWLFRQNIFRTGDTTFFEVPRSKLFGSIDLTGQRTYFFLCLGVLVVVASAVSRLRQSGIGRGLVAIRDNETCAASFGLSPSVAKLTAFAFSGALAALGGALYGGLVVFFSVDSTIGIAPFGAEQSLQLVAMTVIGGLGSVSGTLLGALYLVGLPALFGDSALVSRLTSSLGLLFLLLYMPGGLASIVYRIRDRLYSFAVSRLPEATAEVVPTLRKELPGRRVAEVSEPVAETGEAAGAEHALRADLVNVRFGGLAALTDVSINVLPGEVLGLIGSNGAGKSTLMNVVSGFQPAVSGQVLLWGDDVTELPAHLRARRGVGRMFQDARLFSDLTVRETVMVALEAHERSEFLPSLLALPPSRRMERNRRSGADAVVDFLGLGRYADTFVSDLSTGTRRIVELSCLIARRSKLILLDEPTAGVAQRETEAFGPVIQRIRAELDATVVIIEHDMPLVLSISDHVYCLDAGQVIAEGTPTEVRNDPRVIAAYLGTDERAIARSGAAGAVSKGKLPTPGSSARARSSAASTSDLALKG